MKLCNLYRKEHAHARTLCLEITWILKRTLHMKPTIEKRLDCNCTYILLNAASKCTSYIHTGYAACILG